MAYNVQTESQQLVLDLILKSIEKTGNKNIVVSGGYGLNCVTNYYIKKKFPNVEIYHEPISHDGGTAIGAAKSIYHDRKNDFKINSNVKSFSNEIFKNQDLQNYIRPHMTQFQGKTFLDWSRSHGFAESVSWHPLEPAHRAAADYMITVVDKQNTGALVPQVRV